VLWLFVSGLQQALGNLDSDAEVSVFLRQDSASAQSQSLGSKLAAIPGVAAVRFVSRDAALAQLREQPGMASVIAALKSNPLPDAFVLRLADTSPALADGVQQQAAAMPGVAHAQVDAAWTRRLDALLHLGRSALWLLGTLLGLGVVAVTFNTIRLQILSQRAEIEISKLVGATDATVRRPFLWQGALSGLAGGLLAVLLVSALGWLIETEITALARLYDSSFALPGLGGGDAMAVLALASLLGWLGAFASVSTHLRAVRPGASQVRN
jgi:cell division transport system permease protein